MMNKRICIAIFTLGLGCSSLHATPSYGLRSAETMAYLVNVQQGRGYSSICTYRSATNNFGVHEMQASIMNGCPQNLGYTATSAGGGILREFGTGSTLSVKRIGYREPARSSKASPAPVSKYKRLCDNPNVSESFNQKTGETTNCRTGEVTIDPQIKALKEQGLWPH